MTAECHRTDVPTYCDLLENETKRFAALVEGVDLDLAIPPTPGWSMKDLIEHVGGLHRWSSAHVKTLSQTRIRGRDIELNLPPDPSGYPEWLRSGIATANEIFRSADPDAPVWGWGSDNHARFWPRRMLFETTIHRVDAEFALGISPEVEAPVAVDGVDEFLDNLPHASYFAPRVDELRGAGERLRFKSTDAGVEWTITFQPDRCDWDHAANGADATIEGTASDILLYVYGRPSPAKATGDDAVITKWRENSAI